MLLPYKEGEEIYACRDCAHYRIHWIDRLFRSYKMAKCQATSNIKGNYDVVTGQVYENNDMIFCEDARENYNSCGHQAKLWQPRKKEHLFKLLKKDPA